MDKEQIEAVKLNNSVPDILERYGVRVRAGRCKAICHDGRKYTAKVSNDLYYCFKCDRSMDVFDITMHFTGCDFSEAFEILGGEEKMSFATKVKVKQKQERRKIELNRKKRQEQAHAKNIIYITALQGIIEESEPFSDIWCFAINKLTYQYGLLENYIEMRGDERHGRDK